MALWAQMAAEGEEAEEKPPLIATAVMAQQERCPEGVAGVVRGPQTVQGFPELVGTEALDE